MRSMTKYTKEMMEESCIKEHEVDEMISALDSKKIVIERDLNSVEKIEALYDEIYGYLKNGFTNDRLRGYELSFRFTPKGKKHKMNIRQFVTNLILWKPIVSFGGSIEEKHLYENNVISFDYYNEFYIKDFIDTIDHVKLNKAMSNTTFALSTIPTDFNLIMGTVITLESYLGTSKKYPRFEEILRHELDTNAQPHETEQVVSALTKEQVAILKKDKDNLVSAMLISKAGVRESALQEFVVASSNKPDLAGNTMPVPIDKNYIMGGLSNLINYYIDAVAGRKSIVMNKIEMGKSGYFAFLVNLLNVNTRLNQEIDDCHSVRYLKMYVKDKKYLESLLGRYYVPEKGKLDVIKKTDTHLIGTVINLRSPATCACKGNTVCKTCYGTMAKMLESISVGGLSSILIMRKVQQDILSAKHILATVSNLIKFNPEFSKFFKLYANEVMLDTESSELDDNMYIIIDADTLEFTNVFDRDLSSTNIHEFSIGNVIIKRKKDEDKDGNDDAVDTKILYTFREDNNAPMLLASDIAENKVRESKASGVFYIPIKEIDDDIAIFTLEVENNELTKPLYDIKHILDKEDHNGNSTIDEVANAFLDAIISAKIPVRSVNAEILLYPMIRMKEDKFRRPNFRKHVFDEDVRIMTIKGALKNNNSVTIKLASEALESQLRDIDTYNMVGSSYLDDLFRERLLPIMDSTIDTLNAEMAGR